MKAVVVLVLAVLLSTGVVGAQAPREPIKIGLLNPITGPLAVNGLEVNEGIKLYWEDEMGGQVAGRQVRLIVEDDEGKPDVGLTKTRKLVESDRVHLILGPVSSAVAIAFRDYGCRFWRTFQIVRPQSTRMERLRWRICGWVKTTGPSNMRAKSLNWLRISHQRCIHSILVFRP